MGDLKKFSCQDLASQLIRVRKQTEAIANPLTIEDYVIQTMPDVSPMKWHIAHVTWFFETFLLVPYLKDYQLFNPHYHYLFNSYYEAMGPFFPRAKRGNLSRPTVEEAYQYRHYVDQHLLSLVENFHNKEIPNEIMVRFLLGINHEQQHQELMLMDIKYNFANNPLRPPYAPPQTSTTNNSSNQIKNLWLECSGGVKEIGYKGNNFAFDIECPRHSLYLAPFQIQNRLVTNGEYLEFILAGGYKKPQYWLFDGWLTINTNRWQNPLYWEKRDSNWWIMTLQGMRPIDWDEPVCHVSYYEADAYARWANARLPTEGEWEVAAEQFENIKENNNNSAGTADNNYCGNFLETGYLHPIALSSHQETSSQFFGDVWEWTQSPYLPYPGYVPFENLLSEYNGKFACNQFVLRGGCAVTPNSHIRSTYRNFYYPNQRWPFTGLRLAKNI